MEINEEKMELMNHSITVSERQNIIISGITKIDSFDSEEFILHNMFQDKESYHMLQHHFYQLL